MIRNAVFPLASIILTALAGQFATAQHETRAELTTNQKMITLLQLTNSCSATHTFELTESPETEWAKIIGARAVSVAPKESKSFVVEFNSSDLDAGTYTGSAPVTCLDCAGDPGCGPIRFAFTLQLKVIWSTAELARLKPGEYVAGEILVSLRSQESTSVVRELEQKFQLKRKKVVVLSSTAEILVLFKSLNPNQSVPELVEKIQRNSEVSAVQPNFKYTGFAAQAQNYESLQYAPHLIGADQASRYSTGKGIRIALIDTGIAEHNDLKGKIVERANFTDDGDYRRDIHGTIMAGIISAIPHNGFGIDGVAPDAKIISIKVLKQESTEGTTGTSFAVVQGVDFALRKQANVVNMSLGTSRRDPKVSSIVNTAVRLGIVVVAAAGNSGPQGPPEYPAALSTVIAVSACGPEKNVYASGTVGDYIDLTAPGVGILSTRPGNAFSYSNGSSEAAAHVSGVVALLLEKRPNVLPVVIKTLLEKTSTDIGAKGRDGIFGSGLVDACKSVGSLVGNATACSDH